MTNLLTSSSPLSSIRFAATVSASREVRKSLSVS